MKFLPISERFFATLLSVFVLLTLIGVGCFAQAASVPLSKPPHLSTATPATPNSPNALTPGNSPNTAKKTTLSSRLWNLQDADILSIINEVSQETGKNFVVDPRVNGKITLVSSKPVRGDQIYQVFLSVLGILGYSAVPGDDNVVKIVPNAEAGEQGVTVANRKSPGQGDEVVVRVIPLENVSAAQLISVLRPMLPQWSNIASYAPGNVLILLGRAANLDRIINIIQDVDKASSSSIQIIPLRHASASQVAAVLNNLQAAASRTGETSNISIAVDDRSNSILLGGSKTSRVRMRVLISQLDAPSTSPSGNTEVVYLRYLQAKTLAPLLGKIAQNILNKDSSGLNADVGTPPSATNASSTSSGQGAPAVDKTTTVINSNYIQAEPNTNAIVITAPPKLMQAIKEIVAKLDVRPAQVLVEAIIAEVDESNVTSLGIQWGSVTSSSSSSSSSTSTTGTSSSGGGSVTSFPPLGAGVIGIMPHVQIQAILSLLRNQNGVDILSTPSIMVLDNQKAVIEIGQQVPIQTGSYATSNSVQTATPFTTNGYKDVTLKLDVTPQINLGNSVRLKINLKNDTLQNPQNPGLTPIVDTSKISNSVIISSDDILVLGGLIKRSNNENINKVPIFGDIPIIGSLFKQKATNQEKRNLMVFIKPIIMSSVTDNNPLLISQSKYAIIRNEQANYRDNLREIGDKPVDTRLPPWRNGKDLPTPFVADKS